MNIEITHSGTLYNVEISSSIPGIVNVIPAQPIEIELQLFRDGIDGKSAYEIAFENGYIGSEQDWINELLPHEDLQLNATIEGQEIFNIFKEYKKSNLFINDCVFFENISYVIDFINGAWKLIWLNEFILSPNDLIILRKFK